MMGKPTQEDSVEWQGKIYRRIISQNGCCGGCAFQSCQCFFDADVPDCDPYDGMIFVLADGEDDASAQSNG